MVPSQLVKFVDRPAKFLHMHFANKIWKCNVAEIMGTEQTDPAVFQEVTLPMQLRWCQFHCTKNNQDTSLIPS
jgi:3-hydroxyacyl-CoA dehydrogenase